MKRFMQIGILSAGLMAAGFSCGTGEAQERVRIKPAARQQQPGREPSVIIRRRDENIAPPQQPARRPENVIRDRVTINRPSHFGDGRRITQSETTSPPSQHTTIIRDPNFNRTIREHQRNEIVPGKYYWHRRHGYRYAHYYDRGIHWYGFYAGPHFYWTRYYNDHWWWYDRRYDRWAYWSGGHWYWPGPAGVTYIYVDNNYYPYDQSGTVTVKTPEMVPPPDEIPDSNEGLTVKSPDEKRMVQIYGNNSEAFLYDLSASQPAFLKYLGKEVDSAEFLGGKDGKPLRILLKFKGGSYAFMTENGDPVDEAPNDASLKK